jgi:hypothetical protein
MWNPLASIERSYGCLNAGDLPLVQVQVLIYGLSGEERSAPSGALCQFLEPLLDGSINANADGCRGHVFHMVWLIVYILAQRKYPATLSHPMESRFSPVPSLRSVLGSHQFGPVVVLLGLFGPLTLA